MLGPRGERLPQKALEHYLHLTLCMLLQNVLDGCRLKFCGPDSYNPSNSCSNKHYYIIMRLSVVCPSHTGCRSVWLKGTPNGSRLLPSPQAAYATAKFSKWQLYQVNNFEVRNKQKTFQKYCFYIY